MASELIAVPDDLAIDATIRGLDSNQQVFGRYTLRRVLGRGGMGIVWLCQDDRLEREVALKFLPEEVYFDPGALDDLKRETRRCLDLTHPTIVRIHDFVSDRQAAAISMEYVDGKTLAALRVEKAQRVFEVEEIKGWIARVCQGLHYAHEEAGVVHRDLKPANLMLSSRGQIKIADFGIAQSMGESMTRLTMRRGSSGTLAYMSPQQLNGDASNVTDDVYALGATIYEMLTSKPPFSSGDIPFQVRVTIPRAMAERRRELEIQGEPIPVEWERAIASCLAKMPDERPCSMLELAERLGLSTPTPRAAAPTTVLSATPDVARKKTETGTRPPPLPRPPLVTPLHLQVAAAVALVALIGWTFWFVAMAPLLAKPGQLRLTSQPSGATVEIAGLQDRVTPVSSLSLRRGVYQITLAAPGFDPRVINVTISPGSHTDPGLLLLTRTTGTLQLSSVPGHAHYALAGTGTTADVHQEGTMPDSLPKIPAGSYSLTVSQLGFPTAVETIQVPPHGVKSIVLDLTQLALADRASPPAARVMRGEADPMTLDSSTRTELAGLYNQGFEQYLDAGLLSLATNQLQKLKALGVNIDPQQGRLADKRSALENDDAGKINRLIASGRFATARQKLSSLSGMLEPESLHRLSLTFQPAVTSYQQRIESAMKSAQGQTPADGYAALKMVARKYPDDRDLQLALADLQMRMPPEHERLAGQLKAFAPFLAPNSEFPLAADLATRQAAFAAELQQFDTLNAALTAARNGPAGLRSQIERLKSRQAAFANRRVGAPKGNPFSSTINFFGKAMTGHTVVDNAPYFSSSEAKRDAISALQTQIEAVELSLAQPQGSVVEAQKNFDDFVARVPWGSQATPPPAAPVNLRTEIAPPLSPAP